MFIMKIEELKNLKIIKADNDFKTSLRAQMLEKIGGGILMAQNRLVSMWQTIFMKKAVILPAVLIVAISGTGIGGAYASQSALPGDLLYPVKLASEKVQLALASGESKKAELHLKFSQKRLEEAEKLAEKKITKPELIKSAVQAYENELSKIKKSLPEEAIIRRQKILDKIDEKTKDYNNGIEESVKKAKEKTRR